MSKINQDQDWDLIIKPKTGLLDLRLKQIWAYRDLLWIIVRRDFVAFYKQTILGPVWFLIQPAFTILMYVFLFGTVAKISTGEIPMPLFYLSGIIAWTYFSETLLKTSAVFRENTSIFSKVYFPRLIMPISIVISNLLKLFVQLVLFILILAYFLVSGYKLHVSSTIFLLPVFIVMLAAIGLGLGLIVSALTTKYRDFALLLNFGISFLMYSCPIVYPIEALPPKIQFIVKLNPLTIIIEGIRYSFFSIGDFTMLSFGYSIFTTVVILFLGLIIFNRVEKNFVDTI